MKKTLKEKENILYTLSKEEALLALKKEYGLIEGDKIYHADTMFGGYTSTKVNKNEAKYIYAFFNENYFIDEKDAEWASHLGYSRYGDFLRS